MPDFTYLDCDSFVVLTAKTDRARAKIAEHRGEFSKWLGTASMCAPIIAHPDALTWRYCLRRDGFTVQTIDTRNSARG